LNSATVFRPDFPVLLLIAKDLALRIGFCGACGELRVGRLWRYFTNQLVKSRLEDLIAGLDTLRSGH
jgi:hypothetical protein